MPESEPFTESWSGESLLVLGVDTCGSSGSVALTRIQGEKTAILAQKELAGRTYSATLVAKTAEILEESSLKLADLNAIVVVNGPGSFTGVRVGVSAVKGLAEPAQIPVVRVSRLEVLASKAGVGAAALDAHRHEVFLRVPEADGTRELLAGAEELAGILVPTTPLAIYEEVAGLLLKQAWPEVNLVRTEAPMASDAIEFAISRVISRDFVDLALLDGHYLRRSDAEIFGNSTKKGPPRGEIRVRQMRTEDLDEVLRVANATHHAPEWPRQAYETALDPAGQPRRVALVAEAQSGALAGFVVASLVLPQAELETIVTSLAHQRHGVARELFASLKNELRYQGAREVILEVRAGNKAAQGFYRFLGFVEEGRRPGYYADPVEDAILMRLPIA